MKNKSLDNLQGLNHKAKRYCTFICNFSDRFLDVLTLKLKIIFILLNNQPERVQLTAHIAKIKLPLLSLIRNYSEFRTKLYFKKHGPVLKENLIWCKLACVWQNYWELFRWHVWHYLVFIILFICYIHVIVIYIHKHIYIYILCICMKYLYRSRSTTIQLTTV